MTDTSVSMTLTPEGGALDSNDTEYYQIVLTNNDQDTAMTVVLQSTIATGSNNDANKDKIQLVGGTAVKQNTSGNVQTFYDWTLAEGTVTLSGYVLYVKIDGQFQESGAYETVTLDAGQSSYASGYYVQVTTSGAPVGTEVQVQVNATASPVDTTSSVSGNYTSAVVQ